MNLDSALKKQIQSMFDKAERSLRSANHDLADGNYDFASSRAYYGAFYAIEGLLVFKELTFSKHAGVIAAFNLHFIKSGIFPKAFSKHIAKLFRDRQIGDYDFDESISLTDAKDDIALAGLIVTKSREFLEKEGII